MQTCCFEDGRISVDKTTYPKVVLCLIKVLKIKTFYVKMWKIRKLVCKCSCLDEILPVIP